MVIQFDSGGVEWMADKKVHSRADHYPGDGWDWESSCGPQNEARIYYIVLVCTEEESSADDDGDLL